MLKIIVTTQFKKDLKRQAQRGCDVKKLEAVLDKLVSNEPLGAKFRNHRLTGSFIDRWECHVEPDWLLIYRITQDVLFLERTGSHSDLF